MKSDKKHQYDLIVLIDQMFNLCIPVQFDTGLIGVMLNYNHAKMIIFKVNLLYCPYIGNDIAP